MKNESHKNDFVDLQLGGRPYRLAFDFNQMVEAEKATGENLLQGVRTIGNGASSGQLRGLLYALLKPYNPKVTPEDAGKLLTKSVPAVMEAIEDLFGGEEEAKAPEPAASAEAE